MLPADKTGTFFRSTAAMSDEHCSAARTAAGNYFRQGYNCAESIFLTFRPYLARQLDEKLVRLATPFGGGIGRAGCMCGALSGAVMMLGLKTGRTAPDISHDGAYELAAEFQKRFVAQFGATCCRALNRHPFDTREQGRNCIKIIGTTAKLFMTFLLEKGIVKFPDTAACETGQAAS